MFQWPPLDVSSGGVGIGPQVNKFEQVSSDDHQMSLAREVGYIQREGGVCLEAGGRVCPGEVPLPWDLSHGACDVTYPLPHLTA